MKIFSSVAAYEGPFLAVLNLEAAAKLTLS